VPVDYVLRHHPRSRGIRVTIDPEAGVVVTVPPPSRRGWAEPTAAIDRFLAEREPWIRRHLDRQVAIRAELAARGGVRDSGLVRFAGELHRLRLLPLDRGRSGVVRVGGDEGDELHLRLAPRDRDRAGAVLERWCRDRASSAIERAVWQHAEALAVRPARIVIRDPRSRWGSASREGRLMFSWRLVLAPPEALETVVVHELAHLRVFGHGPRFWSLVSVRRPDHATWRRWLREHSLELHAALSEEPSRATDVA
jgi:predicted metal-dependent hydrolase